MLQESHRFGYKGQGKKGFCLFQMAMNITNRAGWVQLHSLCLEPKMLMVDTRFSQDLHSCLSDEATYYHEI